MEKHFFKRICLRIVMNIESKNHFYLSDEQKEDYNFEIKKILIIITLKIKDLISNKEILIEEIDDVLKPLAILSENKKNFILKKSYNISDFVSIKLKNANFKIETKNGLLKKCNLDIVKDEIKVSVIDKIGNVTPIIDTQLSLLKDCCESFNLDEIEYFKMPVI